LDTMAEISIFRSSMMLDEHRCSPVIVHGVRKGSSSICIKRRETSVIGIDAYISNESVGNILSFTDVVNHCHRYRYDYVNDAFIIQVFENGET
jgi:hypothetical protein